VQVTLVALRSPLVHRSRAAADDPKILWTR